MGDRGVDEIIEQWRSSARGEADPPGDRQDSFLRRAIAGIGVPRAVLALLVAAAFAVIAVPVLFDDSGVDPIPPPDSGAAGGAPAPTLPADGAASVAEGFDDGRSVASETVDDWFALLTEVDAARAAAYSTADVEPLRSAFASGEPAANREEGIVAALADQGVVAQGWRTDILAVSPVEQDDAGAVLRVRDRRGAYRLVDGQGTGTSVAAGDPSTWLVTLRQEGSRWMVVEVLPDVTTPTGQP